MSSALQVTFSGHCKFCSHGERIVLHTTPWCPHFQPATVWLDLNVPRGRTIDLTAETYRWGHASRSVVPGERVICFMEDNWSEWAIVDRLDDHDGGCEIRIIDADAELRAMQDAWRSGHKSDMVQLAMFALYGAAYPDYYPEPSA